ncbi:MAG: threonine--tRNA ligase [Actinobacteria bacterium 13_2_20CM_2_71_6]|nr:MAG: threonine--tRNA ligase [Actinobacteria bacterium 13_2_20CM_2_71_6]
MIDHRQLGRKLDLFDSDPLIGAGLPIWLPAGAAARHAVEEYLREAERRAGYRHVYSPPLGRRELYERSGHWAHFAEDMFPPMRDGGEELVLRPSLCPHHALVYRSRGRSYRELPLRIAELGGMYRAERSGVLGGLHRVRAIQLNDAHIFCVADQAGAEIKGVLDLMHAAHAALGVQISGIRLSLRGPDRAYGGEDADWVSAEGMLRDALGDLSYVDAPGEAAFYGPKIEVQVVDPAGRESTLATIQVDFHQPARFELSYVDSSGARQRPVMVHRSLVGSMERLFGHLIEVHAGAFPAWYAPVQVAVLPIGAAEVEAAQRFTVAAGLLRVELRAEGSLGARVRDARRVPFVAVIGPREAAAGSVSLRARGEAPVERPAAEAFAVIRAAAAPPYV